MFPSVKENVKRPLLSKAKGDDVRKLSLVQTIVQTKFSFVLLVDKG